MVSEARILADASWSFFACLLGLPIETSCKGMSMAAGEGELIFIDFSGAKG